MKSLITFNEIKNDSPIVYNILRCDDGTPKDIWADLKQAINEIKTYVSNEGITLTIHNLIKRMSMFEEYSYQIYEGYDWIDYYIDIYYEDTIVIMKAYHKENYDKKIVVYENRYVTSYTNEGNCIDDFLIRGVQPQLDNINDMVESIKSRLPERQVAIEYHRTGCYEKDFTQISLIKKFAEKIAENCNTQLERISEFYTKL